MAINIKYNFKITYAVLSLILAGVTFQILSSEISLVSSPTYLFNFGFEIYSLGIIPRLILGLFLGFVLFKIAFQIIDENKIFEGDKSVLLIPLCLTLSAFPSIIVQTEFLIISFILLFSIRVLNLLYAKVTVVKELWVLGLINAIAILLEPMWILFLIPAIIGIYLFRSFKVKELLYFLLSISIFYFWIFSILYLLDIIFQLDFSYSPHFAFSINKIIFFPISILYLIIIFLAYTVSSKMVIRKKNQVKLLLAYTLTSIIIGFFIPFTSFITLIAFPFSMLFAVFFQFQTKEGLLSIVLYSLTLFMLSINLFYA